MGIKKIICYSAGASSYLIRRLAPEWSAAMVTSQIKGAPPFTEFGNLYRRDCSVNTHRATPPLI
ncbi:MAG: hypothetical protein K2G90_08090, partial [Muribaculaceae bacterium]|nr:hypothetical protein [Muribaculaceae bacterium]